MTGHSITELKRALKNIKAESTTTDQGAVKGKFKSMDEIRSALGDLEVKQESDVQVMLRLLGVIRGYEGSPEVVGSQGHLELVTALQDIEYYIHQIDNANDFVKLGGFPDVIKLLNHSMSEVREESIHLIGSAAQSNPPVQVELMGLNVMPMLLRQLSDPGETPGVRKKCLFALSSMIRHFPLAQTKFGEIG
uniref:Nucleotide exchange factor SIL1 n=1 Tax=Ciona savignyi TaxID=51511 RepID=H2YXH2_CIOSA